MTTSVMGIVPTGDLPAQPPTGAPGPGQPEDGTAIALTMAAVFLPVLVVVGLIAVVVGTWWLLNRRRRARRQRAAAQPPDIA